MASFIQGDLSAADHGAAAAVREMTRVRRLMLECHAGEALSEELKDEVLSSISRAISALDSGESSRVGGSIFSDDRKSESSSGRKRGGWRKRSSSWREVLTKTLDDGQAWRKYGQKDIQNSIYPRSYFRCTHKYDQGCMASRQVQQSKENPSKFVITYKGEHTCRDPSTIPQIIETTSNLISFGSNPTTATHIKQEAQLVSSSNSFKQDCCNEEVLSNLTPASSPADVFTASFLSSFRYVDMDSMASLLGGEDFEFDFESEDFSPS